MATFVICCCSQRREPESLCNRRHPRRPSRSNAHWQRADRASAGADGLARPRPQLPRHPPGRATSREQLTRRKLSKRHYPTCRSQASSAPRPRQVICTPDSDRAFSKNSASAVARRGFFLRPPPASQGLVWARRVHISGIEANCESQRRVVMRQGGGFSHNEVASGISESLQKEDENSIVP